jgi:phosphatidate cytidylyltransferase
MMNSKRWVTGIVALPLLILLVYKGSPGVFAAFIGIVSIFALWEYFRIVFHARKAAMKEPIPLLILFIVPAIIWAAYKNSFPAILSILTLNLIFSGFLSLPRFKSDSLISEIVTKQVLGIIYIPLSLSYLVFIRNGIDGIGWIFFILSLVFAGDTAAYYVGSLLGRHRLCPAVSPKKTVEGSIGGLFANIGAGSLFKFLFFPLLPWGESLLFFVSVGIAGQVGDLFESVLKRSANVKDSGAILPGHGGILDRIDALLFAVPVAYFFKEYLLY